MQGQIKNQQFKDKITKNDSKRNQCDEDQHTQLELRVCLYIIPSFNDTLECLDFLITYKIKH